MQKRGARLQILGAKSMGPIDKGTTLHVFHRTWGNVLGALLLNH